MAVPLFRDVAHLSRVMDTRRASSARFHARRRGSTFASWIYASQGHERGGGGERGDSGRLGKGWLDARENGWKLRALINCFYLPSTFYPSLFLLFALLCLFCFISPSPSVILLFFLSLYVPISLPFLPYPLLYLSLFV